MFNRYKIKMISMIMKVKNLDKNVKLRRGVQVDINSIFEGSSVINNNVKLNNVKIGFGSYIGKNSELINCSIGRFSCIGPETRIVLGAHPISRYVSIHPAFYSVQKQSGFTFVQKQLFNEYRNVKDSKFSVVIGNDVWIGQGVTILQGISIGDGAVIGAGAVVTKDIEPYSINIGVPAKKIKYRFKENEIKFLKDFKWWNKDIDWIKKNNNYFLDIEKMMDIYKNNN